MIGASVRHLVRYSWWLAVTGITIGVNVWLIVQHGVAMAEKIEKIRSILLELDWDITGNLERLHRYEVKSRRGEMYG